MKEIHYKILVGAFCVYSAFWIMDMVPYPNTGIIAIDIVVGLSLGIAMFFAGFVGFAIMGFLSVYLPFKLIEWVVNMIRGGVRSIEHQK
jgi:hypothetical protein